jgi:hypothetical protein
MRIPQVTPVTRSPQASPPGRSLGALLPAISTYQQPDGRFDDTLVGASPPFQRTPPGSGDGGAQTPPC